MWTIIRLTVLEAWRKRLSLVTVLMTAGFFALYWFLLRSLRTSIPPAFVESRTTALFAMSLGAQYLGLFFVYFLIAFFSIFSLVGAVSGEVEQGLLVAVIPRPLRRYEVILGKWAGFAFVQVLFVTFVMFGVMTEVHLWFSAAPIVTPNSVQAWMLFVLEAWVVSAVTLCGSTFLPTMANGVVVTILFGAAFLAGSAEQLVTFASRPAAGFLYAGVVTNLILPSDGLYRRALHIIGGPFAAAAGFAGPFGAAQPPSSVLVVYAVFYLAAVLALAVWRFARRDL
ncbi:MAG: hypothetical protein ACYCVB_10345 [Bacilli bacterium]